MSAPAPTPDPRRRGPRSVKTGRIGRPTTEAASPESDAPSFEAVFVERVLKEARANGPVILISLGLHLIPLLALALVAVSKIRPREDTPGVLGVFTHDPMLGGPQERFTPVQIETASNEDKEKTDDPEPVIPRKSKNKKGTGPAPVSPEGVGVVTPGEVNVSGALASRGGGGRAGSLKAYGGTDKTEQAVAQGLAWLSRQQKPDGHWELHEGYPDPGQFRTDTGATALALLCFLGAGNTHQEGPYKDRVKKGLQWLLKMQKSAGELKGDLHDSEVEGRETSFYAHGQATIALGEAYALTRDPDLLQPLQDALQFIYAAQHPVTGGWRYRRLSSGDLSVLGWQLMAIQTARMAGLDVPTEVLEKASHFLDLVQEKNGARYKYEPDNPQKTPTPAMTAEGLLCRQYLGWPRNHPAMKSGIRYFHEPDNMPRWAPGRRNVYYWYYAAQVLHNVQGPEWETWNAALREEILKGQAKSGGRGVGGSWHPTNPQGTIDENADKGGRLYVTCMCILTLEVYYRHLPLYRDP